MSNGNAYCSGILYTYGLDRGASTIGGPKLRNQRGIQGSARRRGEGIKLAGSSHDNLKQKEGSKGRQGAMRSGRENDRGQLN